MFRCAVRGPIFANRPPGTTIVKASKKKRATLVTIGIHNVERLVFENPEPWKAMKDLERLRQQWAVSRMSPDLRPTGRMAMLEFLDSAGEAHERAISESLGQEARIDRVPHGSARSVEFKVGDEPDLGRFGLYAGFSSYRDGDKVKITFWR